MNQFNLQRFIDAQEPLYEVVLSELSAGMKRSHWIWFIFPQIHGLGKSPAAQKYAITSRSEAAAYLEHETLGYRLRECTNLVLAVKHLKIEQILGHPDYLKFRSCMTLFDEVAEDNDIFLTSLRKFFNGKPDLATLEILKPAD